ncbi:uncharacterized protein LOC106667991 isoform X2 [Cimex lectularius]|nr:uncharacterized protein LOC106667991 isoform X2 [Cimex lectularius]
MGQITLSSPSAETAVDNSTKIPLKFTSTHLKIRSKNDTGYSLILTQERCDCKSVESLYYSSKLNGSERSCYRIEKNSSSVCHLELRVLDDDCTGSLEINGTTYITGCLTSTKRLEFSRGNRIYLIFYGFNGKVKWRQIACQNTTSHNLVNLLQLPFDPSGRCSFVYDTEEFTLKAPQTPGECTFRVVKSRASVCRLRMLFFWFDLGYGRFGRCEGGFLEVDGYRFCGCQSGLLWTTGSLTFRGDQAILRYVSQYPGSNMVIKVTQEDCYTPRTRFKRFTFKGECRPLGNPSLDFPDHFNDVRECEHEDKCTVITSKQGQISSVRYPVAYPGEICFRFSGIGCYTLLKFDDFDLPYSPQCSLDYLVINETKYCGNSLYGFSARVGSGEITARITGHGGRGFLATYAQVECPEEEETETITTGKPDTEDTSESSGREADVSCRKTFHEKEFLIERPDPRGCVYILKKYNKDVCGLEIEVSGFDVPCGKETLHLDRQYYCGRIPKETFYLAFTGDDIVIEHVVSDSSEGRGKFTIKGRQQDCAFNAEETEERVSNCVSQLKGDNGVATAPSLFPRPPQDLDCAYQIFPLPGKCSVRLEFGQVDIGISEGCSRHYLKIGNRKYCGHSLSDTSKVLKFSPDKSPLELRYRIGKDLPFLDWIFKYSQLSC